MKTAAMILGIIGGIAGLGGAIFVTCAGGIGAAFGAEEGSSIVGLGLAALGLSLVGLVGGALALAKPKAAGIMMLVAGIGGFIAISAGYIVGGPLLIVGGILALLAKKGKEEPRPK